MHCGFDEIGQQIVDRLRSGDVMGAVSAHDEAWEIHGRHSAGGQLIKCLTEFGVGDEAMLICKQLWQESTTLDQRVDQLRRRREWPLLGFIFRRQCKATQLKRDQHWREACRQVNALSPFVNLYQDHGNERLLAAS